jgi:hypothetical protein
MAPARVGILPQEERMAIIQGARKLGLDPMNLVPSYLWSLAPTWTPILLGVPAVATKV